MNDKNKCYICNGTGLVGAPQYPGESSPRIGCTVCWTCNGTGKGIELPLLKKAGDYINEQARKLDEPPPGFEGTD